MNGRSKLAITAILAAGLGIGFAHAQTGPDSARGGEALAQAESRSSVTVGNGQASSTSSGSGGSSASAGASSSDMRGQHAMKGKVTDLDKEKGLMTLETGVGDLKLHFPPTSLQGVEQGDTLSIQLGFQKSS